jgi:hypothetical protein
MRLRKKILGIWRARRSSTQPQALLATKSVPDRQQNADEGDVASAVQQLALDETTTLSAIERLPTELVQHIASYLLCEYKPVREDAKLTNVKDCVGLCGLLEFRRTSRTIHQKTCFLFARCFETHVVPFTNWSILRLLELSIRKEISSRIRSLIFIAPDPTYNSSYIYNDPVYMDGLNVISQYEDVSALLENYPVNVCFIAAALKRLDLVSVFVAPSLVTTYFGRYRRRNWEEGTHPPTVIFNAMILSRIRLEKFDMGIPKWGNYAGILPISNYLNFIPLKPYCLEDLTSLTLVLAKPKCKYHGRPDMFHLAGYPQATDRNREQLRADRMFGGLPDMLSACWNLKHIDLGLEKSTIGDSENDLSHAQSVWDTISGYEYWNLQTLKLSGFVLDTDSLMGFLDFHKQTLFSLHFDNCFLDDNWKHALRPLRSSSILQTLILHQVACDFNRVVWCAPCDGDTEPPLLEDEDLEEWAYIWYAGWPGVTLDFRRRSVREYLNGVFETMHVIPVQASPSVTDAMDWDCLVLPL